MSRLISIYLVLSLTVTVVSLMMWAHTSNDYGRYATYMDSKFESLVKAYDELEVWDREQYNVLSNNLSYSEAERFNLTLELEQAQLENHNLKMFIASYNLSDDDYTIIVNRSSEGKKIIGWANSLGISTIYMRGYSITEVLNTCTHEFAHINLGLKD